VVPAGDRRSRYTRILRLNLGGKQRVAVIDSGFDGFLVLPDSLADEIRGRFRGEAEVTLGGGQVVREDLFAIEFPFDSQMLSVEASFAPIEEILIGTSLIQDYRLEVNFVARTVVLERVSAT
jgi:predicted aspartyl protease